MVSREAKLFLRNWFRVLSNQSYRYSCVTNKCTKWRHKIGHYQNQNDLFAWSTNTHELRIVIYIVTYIEASIHIVFDLLFLELKDCIVPFNLDYDHTSRDPSNHVCTLILQDWNTFMIYVRNRIKRFAWQKIVDY